MRTPTPSAARRAMSPTSPLGPSPETSHHTSTPVPTRMASGIPIPRENEPSPDKKGPRDDQGQTTTATITSTRLRPCAPGVTGPALPSAGTSSSAAR